MASDTTAEVWPIVPISDVVNFQEGPGLRNWQYRDAGVPFVNIRCLKDGRLLRGEMNHLDPAEVAEKYAHFLLDAGDYVVSSSGTLGRVAEVFDDDLPCMLNTSVIRFRPLDERRLDRRFLKAFLLSDLFNEQILAFANGSAQLNYGPTHLKQMSMPLPPIDEQHMVGDIMGALDDRIDNLRATNATLEAIAQALFKSWFVDFDPVHAKAQGRAPAGMDAATAALFPSVFEDSELGPIPEGWRISTLGAFCESRGGMIQTGPFGSQLHASDYVAGGVPVVMPQDLAGRRIVEDRIARTSPEHAERLARHRLKQGDVVFSRRGDVGRHGVVTARQQGWLCGTGCLLVRPSQDDPPVAFVSGALARPESLDWLERHAVGATMPNLNTKILTALPMIAPPDKLVTAFERIAGALGHRVSENLEQAATLASLRDTLLPRLISGKLRLPEARELAEADA